MATTYTPEQVKELVQSNLDLIAENTKLTDQMAKATLRAESAEKKYNDLCERCIKFYITDRDIITDTVYAQVTVPRFMINSELEVALLQSIANMLAKEREREAAKVIPESFKRREDT